jgi:hypothetical protein
MEETPGDDDILSGEDKMELYKFDFIAAAKPPFDPDASY